MSIKKNRGGAMKVKKKRKYYRKCGVCNERHEQSEMIRTNESPNGWVCRTCYYEVYPEHSGYFESEVEE